MNDLMHAPTPATVLVVDDDLNNRKLLDTLLRAAGHVVRHADNGLAALEAIATEPPDLVLLDLMMPGMDGFDLARRLRTSADWKDIPIVMVTALDDEAARSRIAAVGIDALLIKPIDRWELQACLQRHLSHSRP